MTRSASSRVVCRTRLVCCLAVAAILLAAGAALAVTSVKTPTELDGLVRWDPALWRGQVVAPYDEVATLLPDAAAWGQYAGALGAVHELYFDLATAAPALVKGEPVPFVPGQGNALTLSDVAAAVGHPVARIDAVVMGELAAAFLDRHAALLQVPRAELKLRAAKQVSDSFWVVTFHHLLDGAPVAGSRVTLVVRHGNLVTWGSEHVFPRTAADSGQAALTRQEAEAALRSYVAWDKRDRLASTPELVYLTESSGLGVLSGEVAGKRHRLMWELTFRREGVRGTWLAHVDALTGEVVEFGDVNQYSWIRGGIEPNTWTDEEVSRPLPFVNLGGGNFSSLEGQHALAPPVTGGLNGQLVTMSDRCGTPGFPSVTSDGAGNVNFGLGPANPDGDADCTTNGIGGPHNTHAARSAYYHISQAKERASRWLPANAWLNTAHEVRVNITDVCNAYWSPGGGFNGFFQEGFYGSLHCYNTGEIAGIFLHEVGHGLDQNDAQGTADGGTGEAYGDVLAILGIHESCNGQGFWTQQCTGYGLPCTECTGVRDADYAKHVDGGGNPITTPFTPANYTGVFCPGGGFGAGPCGKEVHCEAYPAIGAVWDLVARKLQPTFDAATAWWLTERDWVLGMQIATGMYNCNTTTFASDGCAATSWYQAMLAADDDDGNLANGTPHAAFLYAAFNDHAIACGNPGDAPNQNSSSCSALTAPTVAAVAGATDVDLSWNAVANAQGYAVLRNHGDCDLAYITVGTTAGTTFSDTDVADHQAYSYRVVALGGAGGPEANDCYSALSNCAEATISACPAATGSAPNLANPVANRVDVAWDDSGTCSSFRVKRQQGGCGSGDGFVAIASGLGGSPFSDSAVSGGVTYGYIISAVDPSGQFETGSSPCAEITPTGACNETPSFDPGLTAENSETEDCGIDLAWNTGSTICPAQAVVYNVYRSTTPGFTPMAANRIATGVAGTTYHDATVASGVTYYYVVRAEALTGVGPGPNGGVEDANLEEASAAASGPFTSFFSDNVEAGGANWTTAAGPADTGTAPWAIVTTSSNSPTHSWFVSDQDVVKDQRLTTASSIAINSGAAFLQFFHRYDLENLWDGGVLEYSTDNGATWHDILAGNGGTVPADPTRFLEGGYTATLNSSLNPLATRQAWTNASNDWVRVRVDLGDFNGLSIRLRWRHGCDASVPDLGWWVDDVEVLVGSTCGGALFVDNFESGDTGAWSNTVP